jgi:hypothetical protein
MVLDWVDQGGGELYRSKPLELVERLGRLSREHVKEDDASTPAPNEAPV